MDPVARRETLKPRVEKRLDMSAHLALSKYRNTVLTLKLLSLLGMTIGKSPGADRS